jgi:hypothetical protein
MVLYVEIYFYLYTLSHTGCVLNKNLKIKDQK